MILIRVRLYFETLVNLWEHSNMLLFLKKIADSLGLSMCSPHERIELIFLGLFLFFLPLRETPKTFFLVFYLFLWVWNSWRFKRWGNSDLRFEIPLVSIICLGLLSSHFSPIGEFTSFRESLDFTLAALLAICIHRSAYKFSSAIKVFFFFTTCGVLLGLLEGLARGSESPYLRSVGHINQVAIFLAIFSAIVFALALSELRQAIRLRIWILFLGATLATFLTQSRNATLAIFILLFLYLVLRIASVGLKRTRIFIFFLLLLFLSGIAVSGFVQKQAAYLTDGSIDTARIKLWITAAEASMNSPLIGYGPGSFEHVTSEKYIRDLYNKRNEQFPDDKYLHTSHGHNLVFHWIVERGTLGTLVLIAWILYLANASVRLLRELHQSPHHGPLDHKLALSLRRVLILFSVVVTVLALGIGNTPLRVEHGLLAMSFIGLCYHRSAEFTKSK